MERKLDCRGLACPAPVLKTKEVIEKENPEKIIIIVDNPAARENVGRFLKKSGYQFSSKEGNNEIFITALKDASEDVNEYSCQIITDEERDSCKTVVLVGTDRLGRGDKALGEKLMLNFLKTLDEMVPQLWRLVFLNGGVKLTIEDSPVLNTLKKLEQSGVDILVCGTCLDFFNLLDKKKIGETTNMLDIVTTLQLADKVIPIT
ncbi:MAG: sulfurtransferase-like selenium metabolism protein YedF [Deltaproteobacteria bacterium]|nr:sulfurtransferase-like selenium metabolism protein YedF [Deltaproteobacteria bacterium]MBW2067283.1 sulfurtransferase-like selenium metabolism protein YedF [Deltaproteobacteria bacterium]